MTDAEHAELDLAVARAELAAGQFDVNVSGRRPPTIQTEAGTWEPFRPCCSWTHAGPIIERDHISLDCDDDAGQWYAQPGHVAESSATALVAAMRAYVASRR